MLRGVEAHGPRFDKISRQIWENPELGWREHKSAALLKEELRAAGFRITDNVAGLPTAFTAEWGTGAPVIGIIGEYDALPGLSQIDVPEKQAAGRGRARPRLRTQPVWHRRRRWRPSR